MKIVIVGPGAIGLLLYSFLRPVNSSTYILDKDARRAQRIRKKGIRFRGISGERRFSKVLITSKAEELPPSDLIIICVKSYHTESAVINALPCRGKATYVASFQNGFGNADYIKKYIPSDKILVGVTNHGATLISEGEVKHAGEGESVIGCYEESAFEESKPILEEITSLFEKGGFNIRVEKNIESVIWSKLIVNVGINALTAITNFKNGKLVEIKELKNLMRLLVTEAYQVANAKNIRLLYPDPYSKVEEVCILTKENLSSMLQDILKGKATEIEAINGAIVKEASRLGIEVPFNKFVTELVRGIEGKNRERMFKL